MKVAVMDACAVGCYYGGMLARAGHVKHHGRGELVTGPSAASNALVKLFADAGVPLQISDNVAGALWSKLIINCAGSGARQAQRNRPPQRLYPAQGNGTGHRYPGQSPPAFAGQTT